MRISLFLETGKKNQCEQLIFLIGVGYRNDKGIYLSLEINWQEVIRTNRDTLKEGKKNA